MYKHICEEFQEGKEGEIKYKLASTNKDTVLLKAIEYGVPQTRERLFLVGIKECHDATFSYPVIHSVSMPWCHVISYYVWIVITIFFWEIIYTSH